MTAFSWPDFQDLRARQTTFGSLAGWRMFRSSISANGLAETSWGEFVTGNYFSTLGVAAARGRLLLRNIAMCFDRYLQEPRATHARAI